MGTQLTLNISGLHLTENQFSSVPPGSLEVAENVVLDYPSVAQSRRGFQKYLGSANSVTQMTEFSGVIHAVSNNLLYRDNAGTLSAYSGDVTPPSGTRNRFSEANKALYFTTTQGVKKIFAVGGTIGLAGVEKGMDGFVVSAVDRTFVDGDVNTTDSKITIAGSYYSTGIKTRFTTTGTLPTGLSTGTDYWMRREGTDSFSLYSSLKLFFGKRGSSRPFPHTLNFEYKIALGINGTNFRAIHPAQSINFGRHMSHVAILSALSFTGLKYPASTTS